MSFIYCADLTKSKQIIAQNMTGLRIICLTLELVYDATEHHLMEKGNKMLRSIFS